MARPLEMHGPSEKDIAEINALSEADLNKRRRTREALGRMVARFAATMGAPMMVMPMAMEARSAYEQETRAVMEAPLSQVEEDTCRAIGISDTERDAYHLTDVPEGVNIRKGPSTGAALALAAEAPGRRDFIVTKSNDPQWWEAKWYSDGSPIADGPYYIFAQLSTAHGYACLEIPAEEPVAEAVPEAEEQTPNPNETPPAENREAHAFVDTLLPGGTPEALVAYAEEHGWGTPTWNNDLMTYEFPDGRVFFFGHGNYQEYGVEGEDQSHLEKGFGRITDEIEFNYVPGESGFKFSIFTPDGFEYKGEEMDLVWGDRIYGSDEARRVIESVVLSELPEYRGKHIVIQILKDDLTKLDHAVANGVNATYKDWYATGRTPIEGSNVVFIRVSAAQAQGMPNERHNEINFAGLTMEGVLYAMKYGFQSGNAPVQIQWATDTKYLIFDDLKAKGLISFDNPQGMLDLTPTAIPNPELA